MSTPACSSSRTERLVRRVAGVFVLASLALGWWVHPGFLLATAFVGANLLQSSFTGFCPLERVLERSTDGGPAAAPRG